MSKSFGIEKYPYVKQPRATFCLADTLSSANSYVKDKAQIKWYHDSANFGLICLDRSYAGLNF